MLEYVWIYDNRHDFEFLLKDECIQNPVNDLR